MARYSAFYFVALIVLAYFSSSNAGGEGSLTKEECPSECERRCAVASAHDRCILYCNLCCEKCLCVPSGTSGHKQECPCYNEWTTKSGKPKCP
ncbi:hypothetical protein RND81_04G179400 [Saponaria officinalis]|uniref:Uncharacterized protein n=1 Tax=Saponaria officinalis TaxID=3572 RepID=A0AAW1LP92_SAPOF